jgi:catechol 2,3-dioxygenase-like lactoylglutathione lyase family enzyme
MSRIDATADAASPPFAGVYQLAYVTRDIAAAQAFFGETMGLARFLAMRDIRYPTRDGREAHCHIALAYLGATEIEIIEPIDGDVQHYRDFLPDAPAVVRFHHTCRLFGSEAELERQVAIYRAMGRSFPIDASFAGSRYFYCDFTADLGHYVEGIFMDESRREWLQSIPKY